MSTRAIERLLVGWNRDRVDLGSDEALVQVTDRGDLAAWRELYALAAGDPTLRLRMLRVVQRVPLAFPAYWRAALASLGVPIDWDAPVPRDDRGV